MPAVGIPAEFAAATSCRILTRGRVSGATHAVTVWFAPVDPALYVAARNGLDSDWLKNALAQQQVEVGRRQRTWSARATLVSDSEETTRALEAFAEKYARHASIVRAWRATPPVFVRFEFAA